MGECERYKSELEQQTAANERLRVDAEQQRCEAAEEIEQFQKETKKHQDDAKELYEAFKKQEDLVERLRAQVETYEAAERRRHSYHPNESIRDDASDASSTIGSARPSARGRSSLMQSKLSKSNFEEMEKNERDKFLAQFPMASRTERGFRSRVDEKMPAVSHLAHYESN